MASYLQKQALFSTFISERPTNNLGIIVVIPCYNEPDLLSTLESLKKNQPTYGSVEVIVVVNSGENADDSVLTQNQKTITRFFNWNESNRSGLKFHIIEVKNLPKKHAGVGLARKIGMDEAVYRFEAIGNKKGIIVGLDADSLCRTNYLVEIEKYFKNNPKINGASIYFEHPLQGNLEPEIYHGITAYELHLRYYVQALRFSGFPFAFHTIGSSFAVRSDTYQKQGGMNKRQAGEDFYFLQKIIQLGNYGEIQTTKVIPSPRSSDRVPFGTGRAISEYLKKTTQSFITYHFQTFVDLKVFNEYVPLLFRDESEKWKTKLPQSVVAFLKTVSFEKQLKEINSNSSSESSFINRFYRWFDGFLVLKFVHFARDHFYENGHVTAMAKTLLGAKNCESVQSWDEQKLLNHFRVLDNPLALTLK